MEKRKEKEEKKKKRAGYEINLNARKSENFHSYFQSTNFSFPKIIPLMVVRRIRAFPSQQFDMSIKIETVVGKTRFPFRKSLVSLRNDRKCLFGAKL